MKKTISFIFVLFLISIFFCCVWTLIFGFFAERDKAEAQATVESFWKDPGTLQTYIGLTSSTQYLRLFDDTIKKSNDDLWVFTSNEEDKKEIKLFVERNYLNNVREVKYLKYSSRSISEFGTMHQFWGTYNSYGGLRYFFIEVSFGRLDKVSLSSEPILN